MIEQPIIHTELVRNEYMVFNAFNIKRGINLVNKGYRIANKKIPDILDESVQNNMRIIENQFYMDDILKKIKTKSQ